MSPIIGFQPRSFLPFPQADTQLMNMVVMSGIEINVLL